LLYWSTDNEHRQAYELAQSLLPIESDLEKLGFGVYRGRTFFEVPGHFKTWVRSGKWEIRDTLPEIKTLIRADVINF